MKVVVDANIVISALLGSKATIDILTNEAYEFYAPDIIISEIRKYKKELCKKAGYSSEIFDNSLNALLKFIKTIDEIQYQIYIQNAVDAIGKRDVKDADYIACALALGADFIWTNDKDFTSQAIISIKTTKELMG
jgi:putative PIN family toxin of toxin-antitoxin system